MPNATPLTGKYGRLTALHPTDKRASDGSIIWKFQCNCGKRTEHVGYQVANGVIISCGCSRKSDDVLASAIKIKYNDYRHNASVRGIDFELSKSEFVSMVQQPCVYCGGFDQVTRKTFTAQLTGIDRVDSNAGYHLANCQPCCKICNYAKRSLSIDTFVDWIARLVRFNT